MKRSIYILIFTLLICIIVNCSNKEGKNKLIIFWKDEKVERIIRLVSRDNIVETIRHLQSYKTRYSHEKQLKVAQYLFTRLKWEDLDVRYHDYEWNDKIYKNVEVLLRGTKTPHKYFVVGAHYDSKSEISEHFAPGADDNGSGVAALLELINIIKNYKMRNTIRIVFFSNEESGHHGSSSYVKYLKGLSEEFLGTIIVDMIGYGHKNEDLDVATLPKFKWLALATKEIGKMYGLIHMKLRVDEHCY